MLMKKGENYIEKNQIIQGKDGVYRWIYEFSLLKNPSILFVIWKILTFSFGCVWIFVTLLSLGEKTFRLERFFNTTKVFVFILLAILLLGLAAYLVYAAIMGGKYCVLFEMDDKGITHTQISSQFMKARTLSEMAVLLGMMTGNIGTIGTGLLAGSKQSMSSDWDKVKSVISCPKRNIIKVNGLFNKNQIYVSDKDFEFVRHFVEEHCRNAKVYK